MAVRMASMTVECADVRRMAQFWSAALGFAPRGEMTEQGGINGGVVEDPNDRDVELMFLRAPQGKTVESRVLLILGADDMEAEVQRLIDLGAARNEQSASSLPGTVLRDPEGNEFSVYQTYAGDSVKSWRT